MINVTYYPTGGGVKESNSETLAQWFVDTFGPDMALPKGLRIAHGGATRENDVTEEISLGDPHNHLNRLTGEYHVVEVPEGPEVWVPLVISLVVSVASILLAPTPASLTNRRQESPTNSLGNRTNEALPGERFPDVRGYDPSVYLALLMEPYRRYEENLQSEYIYGTVSTGKASVVTPRDGLSPITAISGAQFNGFWPNTSPNSGDSPFIEIGGIIDQPIVAAELNRNVTGQKLAPPNQLETTAISFRAYASGLLEVTDGPEELDLTELYEIGDTITVDEFFAYRFVGNFLLEGNTFRAYAKEDVSGLYDVINVTEDSITLDVSTTPTWSYFGSGFDIRETVYQYDDPGDPADGYFYIGDLNDRPQPATGGEWDTITNTPSIQGLFDESVGPFRMPDGSTGGWVNLLAQNGLRKASGSNDYTLTVNCRFTIYELTVDGDRTGNSFDISPDVSLTSNPDLITEQVGVTADFDNPYSYSEIVGRRLTNTDKNFNGTVVDEVQWEALYTLDDIGDWTDPGNVTTAYAKIRQTPAALGVQERKINFGVIRWERSYLGNGQMSAIEDTTSDEFADAVVGLALDPFVGKGTTLVDLDVDSLYATQEEIVEYFGTREAVKFGYTFDNTEMTFEEHLSMIAQAVFCKVFRIGNVYSFRFDRPRAAGETALLLNHRLKFAGSDKRQRRFSTQKNNDGVIITYKSAKTRAFETFTVPEGVVPTNPIEREMHGVTSEQVAEWHAWRIWNKAKYRRITHETRAHSMARGLVPDDRIQMANDTLTNHQGGQVLQQNGLYLRLADGTNVVPGTTYSITLLYHSGTVENILCEAAPDIGENWILLFALPAEELYTGYLKWRTAYNLYEETEAERDDMLVESMNVRIRNGREEVGVTAINYDIRYWQNDPQEVSTGSFSTAFSDAFDKGQ